MEIVENKKYYHIDRRIPSLDISKAIFFGREKNNFCGYFDKNGHNYRSSVSNKIINTYSLADGMVNYLHSGNKIEWLSEHFSFDKDETIEHLTNTLSHYLKFTREQIFEEVRIDFFPNYPSRLRCIWIIPDNSEAVKYWWKALGESGRIYELNVSGKVHQASQKYLGLGTDPLDLVRQQAFKYWTAATVENKVEDECLFEGFISVVKELNISDFD